MYKRKTNLFHTAPLTFTFVRSEDWVLLPKIALTDPQQMNVPIDFPSLQNTANGEPTERTTTKSLYQCSALAKLSSEFSGIAARVPQALRRTRWTESIVATCWGKRTVLYGAEALLASHGSYFSSSLRLSPLHVFVMVVGWTDTFINGWHCW
jgi:hypothetical protein